MLAKHYIIIVLIATAALAGCAKKQTTKLAEPVAEETGPRLKLGKVTFAGNKVFSSSQLRSDITIKEGQRFDDFTFQQDLRKIIFKYKKKGYLEAKFSAREGKVDLELQQLDYNLVIDEGQLSAIGQIRFEGNSIYSDSTLLSLLKVKTGDAFNLPAINQTSSGIVALYAERGYVYAVVKDTVLKTEDTHVSDVLFRIREGPQVMVGDITIKGNRKVRTAVIKREMTIEPGQILEPAKIYDNQQRVYALGLFNEVRFEMQGLEEKRDTVDLTLIVREDKTKWVGFNFGYQQPDRVQLGGEWGSDNVFGNLQKVTIRSELSYGLSGVEKGNERQHPYNNDYYLDYLEPYFLGSPLKASISIYYKNEKKLDENYGDWLRMSRLGGEGRVGRAFTLVLQSYLGYKYEFLEQSEQTTSDIFLTTTYDLRNDIFNPRRGINATARIDYAGSVLGGSNDFIKGSGEVAVYVPLGSRLVAAARAKSVLIGTYGRGGPVPINERLYLGGAMTLRGYMMDELSADSAATQNMLMLGNAELRYHIFTIIGLALDCGLFGDAGNLWSSQGQVNWTDYQSDYGSGIRLITPVGPVRVDYGMRTDIRPAIKKGKLSISLGHAF